MGGGERASLLGRSERERTVVRNDYSIENTFYRSFVRKEREGKNGCEERLLGTILHKAGPGRDSPSSPLIYF